MINEGVNGTTPLIVNKMIAHPDTAISSQGMFAVIFEIELLG
jgi:hypothetical protein